jgi:hypothetical protein
MTTTTKIEPLDTRTNFEAMMEFIVDGVLNDNPGADHETLCTKLVRQVRWHGLGDDSCCPYNDDDDAEPAEAASSRRTGLRSVSWSVGSSSRAPGVSRRLTAGSRPTRC